MENLPSDSFLAPGHFPYRHTHDDRFQYRVKVQPVAGHLEFSVRCVDTRLAASAARREWEGFPVRGVNTSLSKDPEDTIRRSKLRAKGMVRLLALELAIDRMFTFTIRHTGEPLHYDLVLKAWDIFRRSMETAYPDFKYIATPERQKNGQWHIHAGTHGFMNINVLRRLWHSALNRVMGRSQMLTSGKDSPGHVHIDTRSHILGDRVKKASKIACYISKYIGKAMDMALNRKKYFHSYGVEITKAQRLWLDAATRDGALKEVMKAYGLWNSDFDVPAVDFPIWRRDGHSAWFRVEMDTIPPPF